MIRLAWLTISAVYMSQSCAKFLCDDTSVHDAPLTTGFSPSLGHNVTQQDWLEKRRSLIATLFGTDGQLPTRNQPDLIERLNIKQEGCLCSIIDQCSASECQWSSNLTKIVWTISVPVNTSYTLTLNSTVFYTINTSGVAPIRHEPYSPPDMPGPNGKAKAFPATSRSKTLVLFHNGHAQPCNNGVTGCVTDESGIVDWFNQVGYDVMTLQMPLYQCNSLPGIPCHHAWFQQFEDQGADVFRFFLEPVVLTTNYALDVLGYENVVMAGLSGGGWTTTMMAAIDPRLKLTMPIAGSMPCDFNHSSWDFEQYCTNDWAQGCNYTCLYVLAALEPDRYSAQIIHEQDPCCFHGCGRHDRIRAYNDYVNSQTKGYFQTISTVGGVHEVNPRDQTVITSLVDLFQSGMLSEQVFNSMPFNLMKQF